MLQVDCEICKNYNTGTCMYCEHYHGDLEDLYEPLSEKEQAELEEKERQRIISGAVSEWVEIELTEEFRNAFNKVKKFAAYIHLREIFMAVWVGKDAKYLVASNTHMLIEMPCSTIPEELAGKMIYKMEGNRLGVADGGNCPEYKNFFEVFNDYPLIPIGEFNFNGIKPGKPEFSPLPLVNKQRMVHNDMKIIFNADYLNLMKETLNGGIQVAYTKKNSSVLFRDDDVRLILMPIRDGGGCENEDIRFEQCYRF